MLSQLVPLVLFGIATAEDLKAAQKELMWSNCSACHNRFRAEH